MTIPIHAQFTSAIGLGTQQDVSKKLLKLEAEDVVRTIFPQEFLLLVERSKRFEFLGWWNNWKLEEPIGEATCISRPIVVLRRKNLQGE